MRFSKTSLSILGIIVLLAITGAMLDNRMNHIWPIVAAIWLFLLLLERALLWLQNLQMHRHVPARCYLGQKTPVQYKLFNRGRQTIRVRTHEILPSALRSDSTRLSWSLLAGEQQTQTIELTPVATGEQELNSIKASILGSLALAWWQREYRLPSQTKIEPDYRTGILSNIANTQPHKHRLPIEAHRSVTFVINRDLTNQLVSGELRRIEHYLNHCSAIAYRALHAHRLVNFIIYDQQPVLIQTGVHKVEELSIFFEQLKNIQDKPVEVANHKCIIDCLHKLTVPGLLIWYTALDYASQTCELEDISRLVKQRFDIVFYNHIATETTLLDNDIELHCRSPYHKLAVLDLKQAWQHSRNILQRAGMRNLSQ